MRVLLGRQAQHRISRIQIPRRRRTVGHPGDRDLPEHRRQPTLMATLNPRARHTTGINHPLLTLLTYRPQIQMILQ